MSDKKKILLILKGKVSNVLRALQVLEFLEVMTGKEHRPENLDGRVN